MHALGVMLDGLNAVVTAEPGRSACARGCSGEAARITRGLPLVHRTEQSNFEAIIAQRLLAAPPSNTEREKACGVSHAVYFFLGCMAYPKGVAAFLVSNTVLDVYPASYTPFDTGSLSHHARLRDASLAWDDDAKRAFLARHLGRADGTMGFCECYLAAHFHDPSDYVRRPQSGQGPDFPAYHGLWDGDDRRAWSIEVQVQADLRLTPEHVDAIVLRTPQRQYDFPDDLIEKLVPLEHPAEFDARVQGLILEEERS